MRAMAGSLLLVTALLAAPAAAWPATPEYEVKAAFIYNFTKFIEWPQVDAAHDGSLELCILGDDPFGAALQSLRGREVNGRTLEVHHPENLDQARGCQIVYVSESEQQRIEEIVAELGHLPGLLLVSDIPRFADEGGTIELRIVDNKVRFAINVTAAASAELEISSRLLQLAIDLVGSRGRS